jgi:excisionase family DNA binding protein
VSELERIFAPDVAAIIEAEIDRRLQAALAEVDGRDGGSPWLSEAEAADHLRVSKRTVQRMVARGLVRSTTIGRRRLLHRDDLDALAATGEDVAPTTPSRRRWE